MGHMINRQLQAFSCNSGNNCTRNRLNCTRMRLVQLVVAHAIIPELHSKACDYLYKLNETFPNYGILSGVATIEGSVKVSAHATLLTSQIHTIIYI